jgi:hypothetical protein
VVAAGETIIAGKVPGERIDTELVTSSSAAITTTETVVMTIVAPVVAGRTYQVEADFGFTQSGAADTFFDRIREDSVSGTALQLRRIFGGSTGSVLSRRTYVEYTADATEDKTFVVTLQRGSGTGNIILAATAANPAYLWVNYLRG